MAAQDERLDVLDGRSGLVRDEGPVPRGVEDAGLAEDALLPESGDVLRDVAHRVERIREDDDHGVERRRDHLLGDRRDDLLVRLHQVVPAHAGLAGKAGGDHHHAGAGGVRVVVRPDDGGLEALDRCGLLDVERESLREAFHDVDQHDLREALLDHPHGGGGPDEPAPDDRDSHARSFGFEDVSLHPIPRSDSRKNRENMRSL